MRPSFSAASIIDSAMRSLTDPPGLNCSHLTHTSAAPAGARRRSSTSGVPPIRSRMLSTLGDAWATGSSNEVHVRLLLAAVDAERFAALAQVLDGNAVETVADLLRQLLPDGRRDVLGARGRGRLVV